MRGYSAFGLWTCAGFYIAIGVIGVFFLGTVSNSTNSTDGYGIRIAGQASAQTIHP